MSALDLKILNIENDILYWNMQRLWKKMQPPASPTGNPVQELPQAAIF